jgi:hypothetical protein
VQALDDMGYSVHGPCETMFFYTPEYYAKKKDNIYLINSIEKIRGKELRACNLFMKNYRMKRQRREYLELKAATIKIQKIMRGKYMRMMYILLKNGIVDINHLIQPSSSVEPSTSVVMNSLEEGDDEREAADGEEDDDDSDKQREKIEFDDEDV